MADHSLTAAQARQMVAAGRADQARALLARALQKAGGDADLNLAMAEVMNALGHRSQAVYYAGLAGKARPNDAGAATALGTLLIADGKMDEAIVALERAVGLAPDHHAARVNLASTLLLRERYADALRHAEAAGAAGFSHPFLTAARASALRCLGRVEESLPVIRAGLAAWPGDGMLTEALASALNFVPGGTPGEVFAAHAARGAQIEGAGARSVFKAVGSPGPGEAERPLRIGIVSPDLRSHSVAFFVEPILRHLDRSRFACTCYFTGSAGSQDATSTRLRGLAAAWRECGGLDDLGLARQIRSDSIDILIELSGHSNGHRLGTMALRPVPLQLTFIGYPNTTGLRTMDGRIVDSMTDPAPEADALATERLLRLDPCFLCYQPPLPADLPDVDPVPPSQRATGSLVGSTDLTSEQAKSVARGSVARGITFGSFNNLQKINREVVGVWSAVLAAVPGSRLVLKSPGLRQEEARREVIARFAARGLDPDRIEALPPTRGMAEHLAGYGRIDIALDTFPYCGTTTTCEAMLMGVPVVTLAGQAHAARVGLSLVSAVGLPELAARDTEEYVRLAAGLAGDTDRLAAMRSGMRARLLGSVLCHGAGYGQRLGAMLRAVWRARCGVT